MNTRAGLTGISRYRVDRVLEQYGDVMTLFKAQRTGDSLKRMRTSRAGLSRYTRISFMTNRLVNGCPQRVMWSNNHMNTIVKTGLDRLIDDGCQMLHVVVSLFCVTPHPLHRTSDTSPKCFAMLIERGQVFWP